MDADFELALLAYRNTKINELDASPEQLFISRVLRSHIPVLPKFLKPEAITDRLNHIKRMKDKQKHNHDRHAG